MADEVAQAIEVLRREREAVLSGLGAERAAADWAAEEQRRWRADVQALLERGRAVGLSVAEMAEALGISRQWTNHLAKQTVDREVRKRAQSLQFQMACPPFEPPSGLPDQP
jgi:site-specific recombinase XerC